MSQYIFNHMQLNFRTLFLFNYPHNRTKTTLKNDDIESGIETSVNIALACFYFKLFIENLRY